jgi:hypothetical protein
MPKFAARSFAQLLGELEIRYPLQQDIWTLYQITSVAEVKCPDDWGMSLVYHFNRGTALQPWLEIYTQLVSIVHAHAYLNEVVEFVPLYEIGVDFLIQCKPPYDGGYSTAMYAEHVAQGNLIPPSEYAPQLTGLRSHVSAMLQALRNSANQETLMRALSALFIAPNSALYWNENRWAAFIPNFSLGDVTAPQA